MIFKISCCQANLDVYMVKLMAKQPSMMKLCALSLYVAHSAVNHTYQIVQSYAYCTYTAPSVLLSLQGQCWHITVWRLLLSSIMNSKLQHFISRVIWSLFSLDIWCPFPSFYETFCANTARMLKWFMTDSWRETKGERNRLGKNLER